MKKHYLNLAVVSFLAMIVLAGCTKKKDQQILDLQSEKAKLEREYERKDSLLNELFISLNTIEKNLAEITIKEKMINSTPQAELRSDADVRDKILDEIILINNIIEENKKRIAQLRDQLKKSDANVAALQETIKTLTQRIEEKEKEIEEMKEELVKLNFSIAQLNATVDTLQEENTEKSKVINQQELVIGEMNTIWYTVGTKKDLMDKGVIDKSGGLFSSDTKMSDMINADNFKTGDLRKLKLVEFETKKAELATIHPSGTYEFIMEEDVFKGIKILNPTEFWKSSRFLVVVIK
jgi:septal ring factor EnvC (AmiA/AmiB activator)